MNLNRNKIRFSSNRPPSNTADSIHHNVILEFDGDINRFVQNRKAKGLSQSDISKLIGYSNTSVIGHFEAGSKGLDSRSYTLFHLVTGSHPAYELVQKSNSTTLLIESPDGDSIKAARLKSGGMTQPKMAKLLSLSSKTLVSSYENNRKKPSVQNWTMFLLITNQHPYYCIKPRKVVATVEASAG